MTSSRPAAVAGMFYPGNPAQLHADVQQMLSAVSSSNSTPKAIIVPHAGYVYSGPVAASAYAQLTSARHFIKRVILLGPCHRVPLTGLATSSADTTAVIQEINDLTELFARGLSRQARPLTDEECAQYLNGRACFTAED